jgi:monofunctional biosynthetic peptidoglycan transglycosylase
LAALLAFAGYSYWTLPDVAYLTHENPKTTALMDARAREAEVSGKKPRHRQFWVPLESVARSAVDAVVLAEDASFYLHDGIDTVELRKAVEEALEKGALGRGASTIPQQLAKNLWLSSERSLLRKAKEMVLARRLDAALSKKRILTLYLNVVEWGDGVYGIEAGALEHFGVHARDLSPMQAAVLAALLPNPRQRNPKRKSRTVYKYAEKILTRMQAARRLDAVSAAAARQELAELFGVAKPAPTVEQVEAEPEELSDPGEEPETEE